MVSGGSPNPYAPTAGESPPKSPRPSTWLLAGTAAVAAFLGLAAGYLLARPQVLRLLAENEALRIEVEKERRRGMEARDELAEVTQRLLREESERRRLPGEAVTLLIAMSNHNGGDFLVHGEGLVYFEKEYADKSDARSAARWHAAVGELQRRGLIDFIASRDNGTGYGLRFYRLTKDGFEVADSLAQRQPTEKGSP